MSHSYTTLPCRIHALNQVCPKCPDIGLCFPWDKILYARGHTCLSGSPPWSYPMSSTVQTQAAHMSRHLWLTLSWLLVRTEPSSGLGPTGRNYWIESLRDGVKAIWPGQAVVPPTGWYWNSIMCHKPPMDILEGYFQPNGTFKLVCRRHTSLSPTKQKVT